MTHNPTTGPVLLRSVADQVREALKEARTLCRHENAAEIEALDDLMYHITDDTALLLRRLIR